MKSLMLPLIAVWPGHTRIHNGGAGASTLIVLTLVSSSSCLHHLVLRETRAPVMLCVCVARGGGQSDNGFLSRCLPTVLRGMQALMDAAELF